MRNLLLLSLILAVLVSILLIYWVNKPTYVDTYADVELTKFAVKDPQKVLGRIFLVDRQNNQALFEKQEDGSWLYTNKVTGKSYRPSQNAFDNMMEAIARIQARNRVPKISVESVKLGIAKIGVKVELYDEQNNRMRTYYIGGPADASTGNFAIMEGSDIPYVVNMRNFQGTLDTRFTARERSLRDKTILSIPPKQLKFLELEYLDPDQRPFSFRIEPKGQKNYAISQLFPQGETYKKIKTDFVETYLEEYERVAAEKIIYDEALRDSILQTKTFAKIRYQLRGEDPQSVAIYPLINPDYDRGDGRRGLRQRLLRYYIYVDDAHFFLGQDLVLNELFREYKYFFEDAVPKEAQD